MPQRKTHDVYSGNQKVGEVWEHYDVFSEAERAEKRQKMISDMILHDLKKEEMREETKNKIKVALYVVRLIIGIAMIIGSIVLAVKFFINREEMFDGSMVMFFAPPSILFALGLGFANSYIDYDTDSFRSGINWKGVFGSIIKGGIAFFIIDFLVSLFLMKFVA